MNKNNNQIQMLSQSEKRTTYNLQKLNKKEKKHREIK